MSDERNAAYAAGIIAVARAEGALDVVKRELHQVAQVVDSSEELRDVLTDSTVPAPRRQQVIESLLDGKVDKTTMAVVSMLAGTGRVRDLAAIAAEVGRAAAAVGGLQVAVVRSAVALTDDQIERLATALAQATGTSVEVRVVVDPAVLGGVIAQVGDTVIDGSVRRRLDQLKQAI